jgi:glycerol uptake facilitator protein
VKTLLAACFGEFFGVFILVFFGISTVAAAIIFNAFSGLMQIAVLWGVAVTLAIYATRHLSCAHLNPAVSLGMVLARRMEVRLLPWYVTCQLLGGVAAGAVLLLLLNGPVAQYEAAHDIVRGTPESVRTAMIFGEYFPNPGMAQPWLRVDVATAALAEAIGTFLLVTMIFLLTEGCNVGRPAEGVSPVFIGGTVTMIISVIAPLTQAGLNPARDFGPRIVAYFSGWGSVAIPGPQGGFFVVYIVAPLLAGAVAAGFFRLVIVPLMDVRARQLVECSCQPAPSSLGATAAETPQLAGASVSLTGLGLGLTMERSAVLPERDPASTLRSTDGLDSRNAKGAKTMTSIPDIFFVGGFLGAGKTTAINSLAFMLSQRGKRVAVITNDQADGLVDTYYLAGCGLPAEEVAGSCFCCNFPGLVDAITHSKEKVAPDVILAEPVGSCTDIVATVVRPMRALMGDSVEVQSYSVLVEPDRWAELGSSVDDSSWSMKFLFEKQLQEADFIVITKSDTVAQDEFARIQEEVVERFPHTQVIGISAKEDVNVARWLELIESTPPGEVSLRDIDYDLYARAEAEMGWLNADATLIFAKPADGHSAVLRLIEALAEGVSSRKGKIGHLKLLAVGLTGSVKAGITTSAGKPETDGKFVGAVPELRLTVNARATVAPEDLSAILQESLAGFSEGGQARVAISSVTAFRPSPPKPTYRYETHHESARM